MTDNIPAGIVIRNLLAQHPGAQWVLEAGSAFYSEMPFDAQHTGTLGTLIEARPELEPLWLACDRAATRAHRGQLVGGTSDGALRALRRFAHELLPGALPWSIHALSGWLALFHYIGDEIEDRGVAGVRTLTDAVVGRLRTAELDTATVMPITTSTFVVIWEERMTGFADGKTELRSTPTVIPNREGSAEEYDHNYRAIRSATDVEQLRHIATRNAGMPVARAALAKLFLVENPNASFEKIESAIRAIADAEAVAA